MLTGGNVTKNNKTRQFKASLFTFAKEKASAKHAGWDLGFASVASKKSREAVDLDKSGLTVPGTTTS